MSFILYIIGAKISGYINSILTKAGIEQVFCVREARARPDMRSKNLFGVGFFSYRCRFGGGF